MKLSIIGTGYVGLVSGTCFAQKGHEVICVDVDQQKVERINRADPPIYEIGLADLLRENVGRRLCATTDLREAVLQTELSMIAVGTPFVGDDIDLRYIIEAARQIGEVLRDKPSYHVVIVKSTVIPGTTLDVVTPILEQASGKKAGRDFGVGMNPEFLREGEAVADFMHPDRIVLGGYDERTIDVLEQLYAPFPGVDKIRTNPSTAETIKYTANALLATMISFSNEIGNLCSGIGNVDVVDVMRGVHLDKRLSPLSSDGKRIKPAFTTYLEAGCGFGGSCFPKDVKALISYGRKAGAAMSVLGAVISVNQVQPGTMLPLLRKHFPDLSGVRVTVLGLAFKPGTDDMRESPAIPIIRDLLVHGAIVQAFDPIAQHEARKIFGDTSLTFASGLPDAVAGAQAVLLLTRWPMFENLPQLLAAQPVPPVLIDGRRMLNKDSIARYEGIGLSRPRAAA